ncbi:uncharacterized protein QC763_704760 [Podospora pseudopauciseta]|uniref:Uncharacterized protein n=1 Tax=Podospora pseudopauciseta TaxID=2093780 RepID=A0ABR0GZE1_9PEZI|nr:hypothetical protein QC763_704760 [Podospora pseudopauciseta]
MKLSSSVFSLGMAGLAVATPVPVHLDIRADNYWYMTGWGNPNCQGSFLWAYQGNGNACVNVPAMAASVSFGISPGVAELSLVNFPTCGLARSALVAGTPDATTSDFSPTVQLIEVNGDGDSGLEKRQVHATCHNSNDGVWAFQVRWV